MNSHIKFFHSIHFKIALVFALILLISLEVVGAVFVSQLEKKNVAQYERQVQLPTYVERSITTQLGRSDQKKANRKIHMLLSDTSNNSSNQVQVIDTKGTIRGTNQIDNKSIVGQKTTDHDVKDALYHGKNVNKTTYNSQNATRYYTAVVPLIRSQNNNTVGAVYIRASLNPVYKTIDSITFIYLLAALITILIGLLVAIVISRAITRPIDEMKKQTIQIAHGDYSGHVHVYGKDELGQLAEAVNNLSVKVRESQESTESERRQLDSVLTHMNDGVLATDRWGRVTISNSKALDFLNLQSENVIGHPILQVLGVAKKYSLRRLFEHPHEIQVDLSNHDRELILHAHFSLVQRNSGFISGLVCVLHDVTEQEKIDEDRKRFVSNVSHELRTPLTSVHAYLETLIAGAWKDKDVAPHFLQVAQDETDRMIRMVRNLLTLSRMDSGRQKMNPELTNLNELFNHILKHYKLMIKNGDQIEPNLKVNNNYHIVENFTSRTLWVELDPDRFTQVIDNIMNNALKYSPSGGTITCSLYDSNNRVMLSIADQGIGIPRDAQDHIFDRFYRVDKSRTRASGGTGLGLSICKDIVEALGGSIWVESTEGHGSTFYISLPYEPMKENLWDARN
ncbi:cell wall metabolism sensor histidine kinase WalK [Acetilactobacillus jinshanensis]|uniref:histidine kinase n=1 Tax=Acetilactobacillus jinshanensis TaxID=1720083 RepID=A0A4P6ZIT3_9LACO|nr:cell wall metabolism sensor histidine kinase WalK [Acetilactobacillus jinshanensis]QBP17615.1 cell wall metabolism sensor histidine kinase WalK [Acetilactobacillus jinshanensis]